MNTNSWLDMAEMYAKKLSGCNKVAVGCAIVSPDRKQLLTLGANQAMPNLCKTKRGCLRVELYGEDSKVHRNSGDCRAIHSEIDAISGAAEWGVSLHGAIAFVTRYPCESCAKALIRAGIKEVYYGGTAEVSEYTRYLFEMYKVRCYHITGWHEDLSDR